MKNVLMLNIYNCPDDPSAEIGQFVDYYSQRPLCESLLRS
jgi:hypothetical protein